MELCHLLGNNYKEDLSHWKQLLLQDGVITSSELSGVSDSEFFIKHLTAMKCKKKFTILKHIEQCECPSCKCLSGSLSNILHMMSDDWCVLINVTFII